MNRSNRWAKNALRIGCLALVLSSACWIGCADLSQNVDAGFRGAFGGFNQEGNWQPGALSTPMVIPVYR